MDDISLPTELWIPFAFPGAPQIRCVFTTRQAGTMALRTPPDPVAVAGRRKLLASLGVSAWSEVWQTHGTTLLAQPRPSPIDRPPALDADRHADGQYSSQSGLALVIKTADCQPILLAHEAGHIAALHVGWRGNALEFPQRAVAEFCAACGIKAGDLLAVRGPSLGWAQFIHAEQEWPERCMPWFNPTQRVMDLWGLARHQLEAAGIAPQRIFSLDLCTYALNDRFFSHRRGDTGRQAALIWIQA